VTITVVDLNVSSVWRHATILKFCPIKQQIHDYIVRSVSINSTPWNKAKLSFWTVSADVFQIKRGWHLWRIWKDVLMFSAEFVCGDPLLQDLIFYLTLSEFYASTILICQTKTFASHRNDEHACHTHPLRFHLDLYEYYVFVFIPVVTKIYF
jgi:hypothetical protein